MCVNVQIYFNQVILDYILLWEGFEEDPVLENDSTGDLHKDTHEDSKTSLDDLTIY